MAKTVLILGVLHEFQGPQFQNFIDDPSYKTLVHGLVSEADFVFEEASGYKPTIAEEIANSILPPDHYLDIDPSKSERPGLGIGETQSGYPIDFMRTNDFGAINDIREQEKREKLWLKRIQERPFERAVLVCGVAHALSFGFRLLAAEIEVEVHDYLPYQKLCTRNHV